MLRTLGVALLLGGCFIKPDPPDPLAELGRYERIITIAGPVAVPLVQFPLSVVLDGDAGLIQHAAAASNIAFTMPDGTALPCEIVNYDAAAGVLEAYVQVPTLMPGTQLRLVYGRDVQSACTREEVWTGFRGVWHFAETQAGSAADATSFHHDAIAFGGPVPTPGPALVGMGVHYVHDDADGADRLCIPQVGSLDFGAESFTFEIWVNPDELVGLYDIALYKGGTSINEAGFDLELGTNEWNGWVRDASGGESNATLALGTTTPNLPGTWSHLAVVVSRGTGQIRGYRDGLPIGEETTMTGMVSNTAPLCFGHITHKMHGWVDEARISATALSFDWLRATHDNLKSPGTFMVIGPE